MFNRATLTTEGSKRWAWAIMGVSLALVIGFIMYGRSPRQAAPKTDGPAKPTAGGETRIWQMAGAASLKVDIPAGEYTVDQTMLVENPGPEARRSFPMRIEPGQTYRWRLATLLSGGSAEARVAAPANGHE
jgi:hypothetical protein